MIESSALCNLKVQGNYKKILDRILLLSRTNLHSRCHLDSQLRRHALSRIPSYPRQLTYALRCRILCPLSRSARLCSTFDCTLRGPFDDLYFIRLSAARTLCGSIITFISASTVCLIKLLLLYHFSRGMSNTFCNFHNKTCKILYVPVTNIAFTFFL